MTWLGVCVWAALTVGAGAAVVSVVAIPLHPEERLAIAAVSGIVLGAAASFLVALGVGMGPTAVYAGPVLVGAVALGVGTVGRSSVAVWRSWLDEAVGRWRTGELRVMAAVVVVAGVGWSLAFAHGLFERDGALLAGYPTTWADWSLHATAASSFAVGHNLPPTDPIFSGTPYRYPFLPDFSSALLLVLGTSLPFALEAPSVVLCVAATVLVVSLARRLTGSVAVGVVAMAIVVLGGGLGFTGLWWDACRAEAKAPEQCSLAQVVTHPADGVTLAGRSLRLLTEQPRAYDGLVTPEADRPFGAAQQWYTPLLAWWLPQRPFVYGVAVVLAVLVLLEAALSRRGPPAVAAFGLAGLLVGVLPLVHVHSLVVLAIVLPLLAAVRRRREWLVLAAVAAVVATPRLVQILAGGHGVRSAVDDTAFPYFEPGWLGNPDPTQGHLDATPTALPAVVGRTLAVALTPSFWGFWLLNTGILVPVCLVVVAGALARRRSRGLVRALGVRLGMPTPPPLLRLCLPLLAIFPVANVVVFQPWDWDNTKLFAYWQLGAALLTAAWAVHWWRRRGIRAVAAVVGVATLLATGVVVLLRLLPWTPAVDAPGPYTWASVADRRLAAAVVAATPPDAVFLTGGEPTDPVLTLAGRRALLGYPGWLFSYGVDYGPRAADVARMYAGCPHTEDAECPVFALLRRYHVTDVELGPDEVRTLGADPRWWEAHFPVVARVGEVSVYRVASP